jgi:NADH-quinone oxidoreductase subunit G
VRGAVKLRAAVPGGSVFIASGTHEQPANVLTEPMVEVRRVADTAPTRPDVEPSAVAAQIAPAAEGLSEMPASAPQNPEGKP